MTCTSCGDKPKGSSKGFPRAVVEINNPESLVLLRKVVIPVSMGTEEDVPPAIGKYFNVLLQYESNGHIYLYSSDGIPTAIEANIPQEVLDRISTLESDVDLLEIGLAKETEDREKADGVLQQEIDDIKNSPDVVDIVATYSDLMAYDTSSLGDNDVIRVLRDETHDGQSAYYRWDKPHSTWTFIGTVGDYYTKQQVDTLLDGKQDELTPGENISIVDESGDLVISATDTTYSAGSGLNLAGTTFSVDTSTIATQADLDTKQDVLTAGQNIHITDESGNLVISADGTTYTAGEAIDITNSVISATNTGKAKVLTSDDYNWPTTGTATLVALWLLPTGLYTIGPGVEARATASVFASTGELFLVQNPSTSYSLVYRSMQTSTYTDVYCWKVRKSDGYGGHATGFLKTVDTVDNLTSTSTTKPLSANQGRVLKGLIDAIPAPTTYTAGTGLDLTGTEFSADTTVLATQTDLTAKQDVLTAGSNVQINGSTISATDTTYSDFTGATSLAAGTAGLVPAPVAGDETKFLSGNGLWTTVAQYSLPIASANDLGGIKVGTNLSIDSSTGVLSATDTTYSAGTNVQISSGNVISATDTTYSAFTGTDGTAAGVAGLVPAPATTDAGKFLKADGTWDTAGGGSGPTVVQTTGTSTSDVMSQNATTSMVFADPDLRRQIRVGENATASGSGGVAIGRMASANGPGSVALGSGATTTANVRGEVNIGSNATGYTTSGYNNSAYRLLTGLYDPQSAHDAATKGYVDSNTPATFTTNEWNALWA